MESHLLRLEMKQLFNMWEIGRWYVGFWAIFTISAVNICAISFDFFSFFFFLSWIITMVKMVRAGIEQKQHKNKLKVTKSMRYVERFKCHRVAVCEDNNSNSAIKYILNQWKWSQEKVRIPYKIYCYRIFMRVILLALRITVDAYKSAHTHTPSTAHSWLPLSRHLIPKQP